MGGIQPLVQAHVGVHPVGFHESLVSIAFALRFSSSSIDISFSFFLVRGTFPIDLSA